MRAGIFPGGDTGGATPVPIPNTVVKPSWADGTALATAWDSRSLPGYFIAGGLDGPLSSFPQRIRLRRQSRRSERPSHDVVARAFVCSGQAQALFRPGVSQPMSWVQTSAVQRARAKPAMVRTARAPASN